MIGRRHFSGADTEAPRMEPLDLHYSRGKLIRLALLSLLGTAMMLWVALGGISEGEATTGRRAWIGQMLGVEGLQIVGWVFVAVTLALAVLYLRHAFADPVAARGHADGVTIHTLFGSQHYAATDVDRIELQHPVGQPILQIVPVPGQGKKRGLAVNGLTEDSEEIEAWIDAVQGAWRGGEGG